MSSAHPSQYSSYSLHQSTQDTFRLPSIKDLNFPPPGQDGAPANTQGRQDHPRSRHDTASWVRPPAPSAPSSQQQHSSSMPPPHDPSPKHSYASPPKPDASYAHSQPPSAPQQQPSAGSQPHHPGPPSASRSDSTPDSSSKRSRSQQQGLSASPARSPHTVYPPYPTQAPPPPGYHQGPPPPPPQVAQPPSQEHPSHYPHQPPPPGYAPYPPPHMSRTHYGMPPPPAPGHHQPPASPYPPPAEHWQHAPGPAQQPPPQQPQFNGYARTTPLVPAPVEARAPPPPVPNPADAERVTARHQVIAEIVKHCEILYGFANHYASVTRQNPHAQPGPQEIEEMNYHAATVMRLLEDLRRLEGGEDASRKEGDYPSSANSAEEQVRPPKRPWEDMARDGEPSAMVHYDAQSTAEHDMQIIRNKRQSSTGGAAPGQQKNKYRKRSRATPPGKCHSCNIRETPEWRRGPDGARTLCNACGLHYAKLMRKREKTLDANGKAPPIDLQTLRASTASARGGNGEHGGEPSHAPHPPHQGQQQPPPPSPYDQPKPPAHPSAYQLMPVGGGAPGPSGGPPQMMPPPSAAGPVPPPPWLAQQASGSGERQGYGAEPQSYVRASHPASHARASPQ